ncbi:MULTISPECIES: metallophosphoesterase [unclassified Avibacterium]|uniref:metallophosphoesterase n=1 Tax=unclassified Avibacterium TaxID=2685287 RepID=UPI002025ED4C|nr:MULTISPECIES: metallophosphoesterase [unclassified Avibacterium]MCW9698314.1 metallophosphoesterase [Avibacterium sp. 20-129]URL07441.1 metallophosphoesterase [Avibacterium sp. 21-595]
MRYQIIFAICIIFLQCFIYIFNRTLSWLYLQNASPVCRKIFTLSTYLAANSIILLTVSRIYPMFRTSAFILAFLLFASFVSLACVAIYFIFRKQKFKPKLHRTLAWLYPVGLISLIGLSVYNAYTPQVIHYQITLDKPFKPLRIGMASDFHLGRLFGGKQLDKLAEIMNEQKVDIILLPGDIMDDNIRAYVAEKMRPHLAQLHAPLGVYATLGNHDFFGQQQAIANEIRQAGITVLMDQAVQVDNRFVLIGRNDDLFKARPKTKDIINRLNTHLPIFLLDHRPTEIMAHSTLPIDIQVSGHAHKGQIFPANLITKVLYRLDYGYEKIGNGHFFVTSGYGFWGIPMRLGSQSEVFIIDVKGKE